MNDTKKAAQIYALISAIAPHYNSYRDLVSKESDGAEVLCTMWEVGSMLERYITKQKIKPHNLYWQIYGKAEGLKSSYITRDFLSYCYRIKKYFSNNEEIKKTFPKLQRYSLFREAFPLLENPKYRLSKKKENELVALLNSSKSYKEIKGRILLIKDEKIGIRNDRTQKIHEMKPIVDNFVVIYNEVYRLIKNQKQLEIQEHIILRDKELIKNLSDLIIGLTAEGLYIPKVELKKDLPPHWVQFTANIIELLSTNDIAKRNRFRKVISIPKIYVLAEMINALDTPQAILLYKEKKNIK